MKITFPALIALLCLSLPAHAACTTTRFTGAGTSGYDDDVEGVVGIRTADFNGDGHPDLVVATYYGGAVLFLHGGPEPGGFQRRVTLTPDPVRFLDVGDINGDGKQDIVLSQYDLNQVTTLLGNGDGTFTTITLPITDPWRLTLADMNADGKLDLIMTAGSPTTLSIYPGKGDGTWGAPASVTIPTIGTTLAVADLDGDGKPDVLTGYSSPSRIDLWHGNGNGTVSPFSSLDFPDYPLAITPADLDGDGRFDIVCAIGNAASIRVFHNRGNGAFDPPVSYSLPLTAFDGDLHPNALPRAVTVGDFLGRGRKDLAVASRNWVSILPANGDGTYGTATAFAAGAYSITDLAALDFNADGRLDFALANFNFGGGVGMMTWGCGASTSRGTPKYATVSASQPAPVTIDVFGHDPITGTVTLREGATPVASATTSQFTVELAPTLPVGDHTLVAEYNGDLWNEPSTSAPFTIHVTTATTTTTATAAPAAVVFGTPVVVTPSVTSSAGGTPGGTYSVTVDGSNDTHYGLLSPMALALPTKVLMSAGTHTLIVTYDGDATHPPSRTSPIAVTVAKATPAVDVSAFAPVSPKEGQTIELTLSASVPTAVAASHGAPSGTVEVHSGNRLMARTEFNGSASGGSAQTGYTTIRSVSIGWLPSGTQTLTVNYWGDSNYTPATKDVSLSIASGTPPPPKHRAAPHS